MTNKESDYREIVHKEKCPFCLMGGMHKYVIWKLVKDMTIKDLKKILKEKEWHKENKLR